MLYNSFKEGLAAGEVGEQLAANLLSSIGYSIEDVSENPDYYSKDIDLIATSGTEMLKVEVKTDYKVATTGNVAIETVSNVAKKKKGWLYYTEATHLFFADVRNRVIHCVRLNELKNLIQKHYFKELTLHNWERNVYYKESKILLVPVSELQKLPHYVLLDAAKIKEKKK